MKQLAAGVILAIVLSACGMNGGSAKTGNTQGERQCAKAEVLDAKIKKAASLRQQARYADATSLANDALAGARAEGCAWEEMGAHTVLGRIEGEIGQFQEALASFELAEGILENQFPAERRPVASLL